MERIISIKLKAALLLTVFALNTVVGFACAVGINMGFNSHHHEEETTTITEHHSHHDEADKNHQSKDDKDGCCHDKVVKISQEDKSVPPSSNSIINPVFLTAFTSSFYNINVLFASQLSPSIKYFVRSHPPPITDIRIAIQSFQI
ncbi:MAG: HYC_CC_PP family protein [Chitinophagaceae bacterium]